MKLKKCFGKKKGGAGGPVFFLPEKNQKVPEKLCTFLRERILKVPEKKYKLKNTRENLKKVPKKQPEKEKKNLF